MKERPILFSSPMVRAILADRKMQTRRIDEMRGADRVYWHKGETHAWKGKPPQQYEGWVAHVDKLNGLLLPLKCPYGAPGDRLWVKETFAPRYFDDGRPGFRADWTERAAELCPEPKWKPSIFMPRALSRITLEVTRVRVERLQDLTPEDAIAEGASHAYSHQTSPPPHGSGMSLDEHRAFTARCNARHLPYLVSYFAELWDEINGERAPWASNPWVWAIDFKRIQP